MKEHFVFISGSDRRIHVSTEGEAVSTDITRSAITAVAKYIGIGYKVPVVTADGKVVAEVAVVPPGLDKDPADE
ncbi:hypothetical protein [Citrobacter braakii]|uniref:hypothetical protein n=1 Tax=Citrobacter braakii TaxID=57706 RepID=UPI00403A2334